MTTVSSDDEEITDRDLADDNARSVNTMISPYWRRSKGQDFDLLLGNSEIFIISDKVGVICFDCEKETEEICLDCGDIKVDTQSTANQSFVLFYHGYSFLSQNDQDDVYLGTCVRFKELDAGVQSHPLLKNKIENIQFQDGSMLGLVAMSSDVHRWSLRVVAQTIGAPFHDELTHQIEVQDMRQIIVRNHVHEIDQFVQYDYVAVCDDEKIEFHQSLLGHYSGRFKAELSFHSNLDISNSKSEVGLVSFQKKEFECLKVLKQFIYGKTLKFVVCSDEFDLVLHCCDYFDVPSLANEIFKQRFQPSFCNPWVLPNIIFGTQFWSFPFMIDTHIDHLKLILNHNSNCWLSPWFARLTQSHFADIWPLCQPVFEELVTFMCKQLEKSKKSIASEENDLSKIILIFILKQLKSLTTEQVPKFVIDIFQNYSSITRILGRQSLKDILKIVHDYPIGSKILDLIEACSKHIVD